MASVDILTRKTNNITTQRVRKNKNDSEKSNISQIIYDELINIYGVLAFNNWLKFIVFVNKKKEDVFFLIKNRFARDWIVKNYASGIVSTVAKVFPYSTRVVIDLKNEFNQEIVLFINESDLIANDDIKNTKKEEKSKKERVKKAESDGNDDTSCVKQKKNTKNKKVVQRSDETILKTDEKILQKKTDQIKDMILGEKLLSKNKTKKKVVKKITNKGNTKKKEKQELCNKNDEIVLKIPVENKKNDFAISLNDHYTFDKFVVGKPNEFAFNAIKKIAEMKKTDSVTNPLFLRGDVGLGKTHLMHAAALHMQFLYKNKCVVYMTAEKFMYHFIRALREKNIMDFKEKLRSVDVLMIDDVQFISGKEGVQKEFFHTFNSLIENKKQLIFAADRPPNELKDIEERIRSRLSGGLIVDIHTTNFELRFDILKEKAKNLSVKIPKEVLKFLAENITTNVRELEGALNRIVVHHSYSEQAINIVSTKELLKDMLRIENQIITIEQIKKYVADYYNIRVDELVGKSRLRKITRPRQIAMFLAKELTTRSLLDIGKEFFRDHTTVMHSIKTIIKNMEKDRDIAHDIRQIKNSLRI